ncbi:hypothetical protein KP509_14G074800 [Ceratopteris richardii]|uniref:Uncharacterized protein n=1 Tax=Ceratopteris richardii TaxID=49495 RepID=A0A8T2TD59_CERRI|nr:hypothetical protein KP509_14G074800 [Ceratopteris richardii]
MNDLWTPEQNKRFEQALALHFCGGGQAGQGKQDHQGRWVEETATAGRWEKIAAMVPGKSPTDVRRHYYCLLEDVIAIEAGKISLPNYDCHSPRVQTAGSWHEGPFGGGLIAASASAPASMAKTSEQERKKGIPWTEEEHRLFLLGLEKFGKGDWRSISRNFVVTRTPTQVASHAQKYFNRLNSTNKDKRRSSIHDITNATVATPTAPTAKAATTGTAAAPHPSSSSRAHQFLHQTPHFIPPPAKVARHQ